LKRNFTSKINDKDIVEKIEEDEFRKNRLEDSLPKIKLNEKMKNFKLLFNLPDKVRPFFSKKNSISKPNNVLVYLELYFP
jgi:hypothetical protein